MQKIKFRVWDSILKKMYKHHSNLWVNLEYGLYNVWGGGGEFLTSIDPNAEKEILFLMQYTNFKDKNGKEIYEGDILMGSDSEGISGIIPDIVFWENTRGQWMLRNSENPDDTLWEIIKDGVEIIGNIYQNPELCQES